MAERCGCLHGTIAWDEGLSGVLDDSLVITSPGAEIYQGDTLVVPSGREQILETADKVLKENIVVEKIPIYEVTNQAGGLTVNIGG